MRNTNAQTPLSRLASTLRLWSGLGLLAAICLLWSPFALILFALNRSNRFQKLGRAMIRVGFPSI